MYFGQLVIIARYDLVCHSNNEEKEADVNPNQAQGQ